MKLIGIITPCFNEEKNVGLLCEKIEQVFKTLPDYEYEHIFIDNASDDQTVANLRLLASKNKRVKVIVNNRNFGTMRSPYHALMQAHGDAVISIAADLQDPPEVIPRLIEAWERGERFVAAVKTQSEESKIIYALRTLYYRLLNSLANVELIEHYTGFGLYDRSVIEELRKTNDRFPYFRGLLSELGFSAAKVNFVQPLRKYGKSRQRFYDLYEVAINGLTSHSILPMRVATFFGFIVAIVSFLIALFYLVYKLLYWQSFDLGIAPLVIGMFLIFSVQLMFIGLLGEYIGATHMQILTRPLVVEKERINFDDKDRQPDSISEKES